MDASNRNCYYIYKNNKNKSPYRMRGNVCGTKFLRFSRTAWSSAKVESVNFRGTRDYIVIIKWPT